MINITCKYCKQEVEVPMYFSGEKIITTDNFMDFNQKYEAVVNGKAICPLCGNTIQEIFYSTISKRDIVWLTTGEQI